MKKLNNLIYGTHLIIVALMWLLGSVTEVNIPVIATLCGLLVLSIMAYVFFTMAKKRYMALCQERSFARMNKAASEIIKEREVA